jgi:hypothetical protein
MHSAFFFTELYICNLTWPFLISLYVLGIIRPLAFLVAPVRKLQGPLGVGATVPIFGNDALNGSLKDVLTLYLLF